MKKTFIITVAILITTFFTYAQNRATTPDSIPDGPYFEKQGKMSVSGYYKDNLKTGNWTTFFGSEQIHIVEHYILGKKNGLYLKISKRGYIEEQSQFVNDSLSGKKIVFSIGGKTKLIENYKDGVLDGKKTIYYDRGKKQEESNYKLGVKNGVSKWYNTEEVLIAEYNYSNGVFDGTQQTYYTNDTLRSKKNYEKDVVTGMYIEYFDDGNTKIEGSHKNGFKSGKWLEFNEEGALIKTTKYRKGAVVD